MKLETRGPVAIAWLANAPMNAVHPQVIADLKTIWEKVKADDQIRALVIYSSVPIVFSAGADIKAFTQMDPAGGKEFLDSAHALFREFETEDVATIAAVNALAYGGGCELAMACDFRIAAEAAVFGQPEIKLGIIPGFGGTQRLPRLVGENKALEMNLIGDAILSEEALNSASSAASCPITSCSRTALMWAGKLAEQAPIAPVRSSRSPPRATSTRASRRRRAASPPPSRARTPKRASPPSSASARLGGAASKDGAPAALRRPAAQTQNLTCCFSQSATMVSARGSETSAAWAQVATAS